MLRVDPRSGRIMHAIGVGNAPAAIAAGAGALWVANAQDGTVSRIDPEHNAVVATIRVGDGPAAVAAGADRVWVASELAGTIAAIDPDTDAIATRHDTGQRPVGVALGGGRLWVAARDATAAHQGGTLRVGDNDIGTFVDQTDYSLTWQLNLTGDGLTTYRRAHGADGATLVPDLAVAIPTPTDGGRTYTFQVRRGVRYSSGETVGAADFRRAIERYYRVGPVPVPYYDAIAGASACRRRPAACDLSRGIVTEPRRRTRSHSVSRARPQPSPRTRAAVRPCCRALRAA